jgi:hypothetical protein
LKRNRENKRDREKNWVAKDGEVMHEKLLKGRHFCSKLISFSENQTKAGFFTAV